MTTVFSGTGRDARKIVDELRAFDFHVSIFVTVRDGRRTEVKLKVPDNVANSARSHVRWFCGSSHHKRTA